MYDFESSNPDELPFKSGDIIIVRAQLIVLHIKISQIYKFIGMLYLDVLAPNTI